MDFEKVDPTSRARRRAKLRKALPKCLLALVLLAATFQWVSSGPASSLREVPPVHVQTVLARCRMLQAKPSPPDNAASRGTSDRFEVGSQPYLIRNATIWTGALHGHENVTGDILIANGLIKKVGKIDELELDGGEVVVYDAGGAWVTPGIIDLHTHMGVLPSPELWGTNDGNSLKGPIQPWLRALDGLNTHDDAYRISVAGGITTALFLPGSANAIGGEGFVIKTRPTKERSSTAMLVEPPPSINGSDADFDAPLRWRHMKHACGENPSRIYGQTRMDSVWQWREAYEKARQLRLAQDDYCVRALDGKWKNLGKFPEDLKWEGLVAVLRGWFKVQTHCYEATDITNFVRLTNEFKFQVAAFHHAHEAYLVPQVLKQAYEHPPAIAMFASFSRYKREAFRHSQFAPRILADEGLDVVMKSDHPAIVRTLVHEAQQAHYYGLPANVSLASVTTTPAKVLGLDWRLGHVKEGYDADIVVWDSHPLALGATPKEVFIDGIPQLKTGLAVHKTSELQVPPKTPDFEKDIQDTLKYEGLPPLAPLKPKSTKVIFINVGNVWTRRWGNVTHMFTFPDASGIVAVESGTMTCAGSVDFCASYTRDSDAQVIDLQGGALSPGLVAVGTTLGLQEIAMEASTTDGVVHDFLLGNVPRILGGEAGVVRAVDGLQFGTRDALLAYRAGVTTAVSAPASAGFLSGLSTAFSTGAAYKFEDGAVVRDVVALHVSISSGYSYSVSTQIATLRRLLLESGGSDDGKWKWFGRAAEGSIPLVVSTNSADIMASVLVLKKEVEEGFGTTLKLTFLGGTEAHLLAAELAAARVGVIVTPPRSFPYSWEHRRILPGPPLSAQSLVTHLVTHGVTVGIGPQGLSGDPSMSTWAVQNARWDAGWAALDSNGTLSKEAALALVSTNVEKLLGLPVDVDAEGDLVATAGGDLLSFESKVVAVVSPRRGVVDLFGARRVGY